MSVYDFRTVLATAKSVDLNAVGDTAVTIPNGSRKYIVRGFVATNASTSLGASAATLGLYSAAAAGGEAIVTPATMTGLTASTKFKDHTIAQDDTITASTLYIRNGVVHGTAATCDVYIYGDVLP